MRMQKTVFTVIVLLSLIIGTFNPLIQNNETEIYQEGIYTNQYSPSADYPPFEPPTSNEEMMDNGSLLVNGQEFFWRYFFPNTSSIQPLNFGFSFEIWWKNPTVGLSVVFNLTEIDDTSSIEKEYSTVDSHEEIIQNSGGEFVQYSIWSNTTYFFVNETWASLADESIDSRNLNLSLGIRHDTFFPVFEYSIHRDTRGPTIQIIHPNYNAFKKELYVNESSISFDFNVSDESGVDSIFLIGHFLNQTTQEADSMLFWEKEFEPIVDSATGTMYCPSLIVTKYVSENGSGGGIADLDYYNILSEIVVLDSFGQETRDLLTIIINNPLTNTTNTTTTTQDSWYTSPIVLGTLSVVGIVAIFVLIRKK